MINAKQEFKHWTGAEVNKLIRMTNEGMPPRVVAQSLNRTCGAIRSTIIRLRNSGRMPAIVPLIDRFGLARAKKALEKAQKKGFTTATLRAPKVKDSRIHVSRLAEIIQKAEAEMMQQDKAA